MSFWAGFLIGSFVVVLIVVFIKYFGTDIKNRISEAIKNRHKKCECVNIGNNSSKESLDKSFEKSLKESLKNPLNKDSKQ